MLMSATQIFRLMSSAPAKDSLDHATRTFLVNTAKIGFTSRTLPPGGVGHKRAVLEHIASACVHACALEGDVG